MHFNQVGRSLRADESQKVISVESLEIQPDYQLAARFDALLALADGWLDGRGIAPDKTKLAAISEQMVGHYSDELPLPAIVPTPEGNLLFEWDAPGDPSVDLHLESMRAAFHAFQPNETGTEQEILLTTAASWGVFFSFLIKVPRAFRPGNFNPSARLARVSAKPTAGQ